MYFKQAVKMILLSLAFGAQAWAAEDAPFSDKLLGDFAGRSKLADAGVTPSLDYSGDLWTGLSGGKKRTENYLDLITLRVDLDGQKLLGIKGNTMSVALIRSNGSHPNASSVGSTQGIDNDEVGADGTRLYEAWVNQEFMDGRIAVLVGLHDLNSEFSATEISDNFIKPTMQTGQSLAQSGRNGPSIFPVTSLAGRVRVKPTENSYVAAAVYDGVPGDTDHNRSNPVHFDDKDGLLLIGEIGYVSPLADQPDAAINKIALGFWDYTARLDDQVALDAFGNPAKSLAQGAYLVSSYQFYHDKAKGRNLGAFFRGGVADGDTAQVDWDYTAGLVANGWMPSRPESEIGLGISQAHNSDSYVQSVVAGGGVTDRNEYSYELYYRDTIARGVHIQPDLQYVVNPGTDVVTDNATILGMRLDVSF